MRSIIGLINDPKVLKSTMERPDKAGISAQNIDLLFYPNSVYKVLGYRPVCILANDTDWKAAICGSIYAIDGITALCCECGLTQYERKVGLQTLPSAALAGSVAGGMIGRLPGLGEFEKDPQLYFKGDNFSEKEKSIQVPDENTDRAGIIVINSNLLEAETIETSKGV